MTDTFNVPRPAIMAVALALAESEGMTINQQFLRDAEMAVSAVMCPEMEGCLFIKGHDSSCSPVLVENAARYGELQELVGPLIDMTSGPLSDIIREFIADDTT